MCSTHILVVSSWSKGAKEDLISNLGPHEWMRQEVLWEIIASEEQYVGELQKMKETIDPLLHPYASPPPTSPTPYNYDDYSIALSRFKATQDSMDTLPPIAAHFMSPTSFCNEGPSPQALGTKSLALTTPNINGESVDTNDDDADVENRNPLSIQVTFHALHLYSQPCMLELGISLVLPHAFLPILMFKEPCTGISSPAPHHADSLIASLSSPQNSEADHTDSS
ncbi:hypothetical protein EDC04DRAFT_2897052 [Pisolithus marmoratus]|nr:hypothetical protein EDC04DRAFT_2897052 [Pisolithus marmoratus]